MISTPGDHLPPEAVYTKAFLVAIKLASLPTIRSSKAVDKEHPEIMSCESSMRPQSVGQVIILYTRQLHQDSCFDGDSAIKEA